MDKNKKIFLIKFIIICKIILYYFFEIKKRFKFINNKNYELAKSLYNKIDINSLINYVNNCKFLKRINNNNIVKREHPFLSICISTYNSEKYIEKAILSVINQSFQNFEIIVVK